jgi:hypothetical protein
METRHCRGTAVRQAICSAERKRRGRQAVSLPLNFTPFEQIVLLSAGAFCALQATYQQKRYRDRDQNGQEIGICDKPVRERTHKLFKEYPRFQFPPYHERHVVARKSALFG